MMQLGHPIKRIILLQVDECLCLGEMPYDRLLRSKNVLQTLRTVLSLLL